MIIAVGAVILGQLAITAASPAPSADSGDLFALPSPPAGSTWHLAFGDEFTGATLDSGKFSRCFDWNFGGCTSSFNNGRETYSPRQVVLHNGVARLIATPLAKPRPDEACYQGECTYVSGMLSTARPDANDGSTYRYTFTYGYVEARLKFPSTPGFFTAFWLLPAEPSYIYSNEIDILEQLGDDPTMLNMAYRYSNRTRSFSNAETGKNGACPSLDYSQGYHTYGVNWQPGFIAWYVDGMKCQEYRYQVVGDQPMQIILNLMVDVDWQRTVGSTLTDGSQTRELGVDYVRVYQAGSRR